MTPTKPRTIKATANKSARTFTLRYCDENGNLIAKYRTFRMSKEEFESSEHHTQNDWKQFLKTPNYFKV